MKNVGVFVRLGRCVSIVSWKYDPEPPLIPVPRSPTPIMLNKSLRFWSFIGLVMLIAASSARAAEPTPDRVGARALAVIGPERFHQALLPFLTYRTQQRPTEWCRSSRSSREPRGGTTPSGSNAGSTGAGKSGGYATPCWSAMPIWYRCGTWCSTGSPLRRLTMPFTPPISTMPTSPAAMAALMTGTLAGRAFMEVTTARFAARRINPLRSTSTRSTIDPNSPSAGGP